MSIDNNKTKEGLSALGEEEFLRQASLQQPVKFLHTYLSDEREDLYQEVLNTGLKDGLQNNIIDE